MKKKKETSFRRTTNYIYSHSTFLSFFLSFVSQNSCGSTFTLLNSVPENDFWKSVVTSTRYNIPLFYTHDLHIRLAFSRVLALPIHFSLILVPPSLYQSLFTYLLFCCTFFRQYANAFTLYTSFLAGPWRKRAGCWPD